MKLTRHNGRAGKNGTYNPKHNDRRFDVENSDHIDTERAKQNIYWDCFNGYRTFADREEEPELAATFEEVEQLYYVQKYSPFVEGQNARNAQTRHTERNRSIEEIRMNKKTCPEETVYQIGNMEEYVSPEVLLQVVTEFIAELNRRFGSHIHTLDWALHLDESTPHIHERHVFDCENKYGELFPQQEKALEALGFELPEPEKKPSRYNNRKMVFDEECRKLFISICQNHGLTIDVEPVYGGASYLEKQDFIIMNQKKRIEEKQAVLDGLVMKIEDVNAVIEEAVDLAYEKACEVVTKRVKEETVKHDVDVVKDYGELLQQQPKDKLSDKSKSVASKVVNAIVAKLEKASQALLGNIISALNEPKNKVKAKEQIKEQARVSIQAKLKEKQKQVMEYEKKQDVHIRKKNMEL